MELPGSLLVAVAALGEHVMNQGLQYEIDSVMPAAIVTGLFVSLCTIQVPDGNYGLSGAPSGVFVNSPDPTLIGIPCMDTVPSIARVQATELKDLAEITAKSLRHILLAGYFPQLVALKQAGQVRVAITDPGGSPVVFEMLGAENDSQQTQTRFECQIVTV